MTACPLENKRENFLRHHRNLKEDGDHHGYAMETVHNPDRIVRFQATCKENKK